MGTGATRERILDVAVRSFAERGVAATPVTAIEHAAGLSPGSGSFYRHFRDKEQLLEAVVEREMSRVAKDPSAQVANSGTGGGPGADLATQLRMDLDFLCELRPLMAILMWERGRAPQVARRVRATMVDRGVEQGVADLLTQGCPVEDAEAAAAVMTSAVVGYFLTSEFFGSAPGDVDAPRFASTLAGLLGSPGEAVI